jgi:chromosome segregation ATPase
VTAEHGAPARHTAAPGAGLDARLAETEDRLRERVAELTAAVDERRHLEADLMVRADYLSWMRESLEAATEELARSRAERDGLAAERDALRAERDRVAADALIWRRDALLLDRLRRSAHRLPLYTRLGHPVLRRIARARR